MTLRWMPVSAALCVIMSHASSIQGCSRGKFIDNGVCTSCPVGKWQSQPSKTLCWECPLGHFQPKTGLHSCYTCPTGRYQDGTGASTCKACNSCKRGHYGYTDSTANTGKRSCKCASCDQGKFAPAHSSKCHACPAGRFTPQTSSYSCYYCPTGTFQEAVGQNRCKRCNVGETTKSHGAKSRSNCETSSLICGVGNYRAQTTTQGVTVCQSCPAGMFGKSVSAAYGGHCYPCPDGQAQDKTGQLQCNLCKGNDMPSADRHKCHNPTTFNIHFRLYNYASAAEVKEQGWHLITHQQVAAMKNLVLGSYEAAGGMKLLGSWKPSQCCIAVAGGFRLTLSGKSYAYPFDAAANALKCNGERYNAELPLGIAFQDGKAMKPLGGAASIGASVGHGICSRKTGETNPGMFFALTPTTVPTQSEELQRKCTMLGTMGRICLPAQPTPAPVPVQRPTRPPTMITKADFLANLHTSERPHDHLYQKAMQLQLAIDHEQDRQYSPAKTRACCQDACAREQQGSGCSSGCKLWIGHTSLNWVTKNRGLLSKQCKKHCEGVSQKGWVVHHTRLNPDEKEECEAGCKWFEMCSYH